ncbi:Helicase-like transcription factor [Chelonia mydas]|uniref:Helicase-like transcription factor n=1 Tax=Chelonia mydas TaxID=8469 RepID=M7C0X3_CHEMY|nr:Helicase-like transcription factor [Chelonia mydas]
MAWMFMRDSAWKYLQSAHHGGDRNYSHYTSRDFYSQFGLEDFLCTDDIPGTDEDMDSAVLFGTLRGNVVGLRYYTGVVNNNEMVALQREPNNLYDKNAVKVNNVNGNQVGHIKKELAAPLAYIMDNKLAIVEGVVPYGAQNAFTMPVQMSFWGKEENKQAVLDKLKMHGFKLAPPSKSSEFGFGSSWVSGRAGPSYSAPGHAAMQMTTEQLKSEFDKLFEDLKEDDKTHEMEGAEAVGTPLLPHQKQALAWMVSRENSKELPLFWEEKNNFYYNTLTNFAEKERPENVLGGILADDMGLGKTLATIALILTNFHDGKPLSVEKIKSDQLHKVRDPRAFRLQGSQLTHEFLEALGFPPLGETSCNVEPSISNVKEKSETVQSQCSSSRPKRAKAEKPKYTVSSDSEESEEWLPQQTRTASCVIQEDTGFASALASPSAPLKKKAKKKGTAIVQSVKKNDSEEGPRTTLIICPLSVLSNWIDQFEQHIRPDVRLNIYVYYGPDRSKDPAFISKQDIVLTTYNILASDYGVFQILFLILGTPIQNSLKDLWSLLSFLKLKPFTDREWWHRTIQRPVMLGDQGGLRRLQSLIKNITLRRTKTSKIKGKPVLELPERKVFIQHVTLTEEERKIYQSVKNEGKAAISRYFNEGTVLAHYADVLGVLLRLRQLCCHPHLCTNTSSSSCQIGYSTPEELREKLVNKMKLVLSSGSDEECAICLDSLNLPVITHCAHVFCKPCICEVIQSEQPNAKCPLCRNELRVEHLVECPLEESDSSLEKKGDREWISSSKINALMHALIDLRKQNPAVKCLIVSQFTTFLSLIETPLKESGFVFTRLNGSMPQKKRVQAIQSFQDSQKGSPTIMLLSLKAGGVGLNLTAASRVFLMDPFIVKNSVEENMLKIQNKKRELAAGAFASKKLTASEVKQTKINEIKTLIDL